MNVWRVDIRVVEHADVRGIGVYLTDGENDREVGRVAFVRELARKDNKEVRFEDQLDDVLEKADRAVQIVNESLDEVERINEQADLERVQREERAVAELASKLREAIGSAPRPNAKFA